jgi:hypothetical protein
MDNPRDGLGTVTGGFFPEFLNEVEKGEIFLNEFESRRSEIKVHWVA